MTSHVGDYIELHGSTGWAMSDEQVESSHALLERRALRHGVKKVRNLTSRYKQRRNGFLLSLYNAKNRRKRRR